MMHHPISINSLGLHFPQKVCFEDFSTRIHPGMRIALVGRNGSGKSTLINILRGHAQPSEGEVFIPDDVRIAYVPQVIEDFSQMSGGQRLNEALTKALITNPNVLLLDEPTNHLDLKNRRSLMRLLQKFPGTLIVVSHDIELLRTCINTLWHIDQGKVTVFSGHYDDYIRETTQRRTSLEKELSALDLQKKETHSALMQEQTRAKNSRLKGEKHIDQRKWPTVVSGAKARRAEETSGRKKHDIHTKKHDLSERLAELRLPEIIVPTFSLKSSEVFSSRVILSIAEGGCRYNTPVLESIFLSLSASGRLAIKGDNGSGKSTLVKGILNDPTVIKSGEWITPKREDIGYLDQHYSTLTLDKSVRQTIQDLVPTWTLADVRRLLNDFLFRKNEEASAMVSTLSGGEKARLSLAQIAAKTPKLLILDEITNNLDLETRNHVVQVLKQYPGAMIVISHDEDFLKEIGIEDFYELRNGGVVK
ncbi:MAG: ATP-binding cassette domain-containing protein [Alphaproteobacteria bacterium]|jgi:ATPase subunit of ABC transporter with duplicated ATPase domains|nr:ATP-binding cassette domain-containing protein [Alphaproteobacteria bacterium]